MTDLQKDIRSIYIMAPIWEPSVWQAIQNRDYEKVELQLRVFLEKIIEPGEWTDIYWPGILNGIPMFKESVSIDEWEMNVLPAIARAVRGAISDEELNSVYQTLQEKDLKKFHGLMSSVAHDVARQRSTAPQPAQQKPEHTTIAQGDTATKEFVPAPQATPQQAPPQAKEDPGSLLSPAFGGKEYSGNNEPPQSAPAPFIIHEETEIQPTASHGIAPLDRPQFFKSTAEEKPYVAPATARLEIGEEVFSPPQSQQVGHTKREEPRIVNYTAPVVQADPFVRPPQDKKPAEEKPTHEDVSPENIINLRDLPK